MSDKDKKVVLGVFDDEPKADAAVKALKEWEKTDDRVKMNAIGVLVLDDNGHVKTHKLGSRSVAKGAGIGLILAAVTPVGLVAGDMTPAQRDLLMKVVNIYISKMM